MKKMILFILMMGSTTTWCSQPTSPARLTAQELNELRQQIFLTIEHLKPQCVQSEYPITSPVNIKKSIGNAAAINDAATKIADEFSNDDIEVEVFKR